MVNCLTPYGVGSLASPSAEGLGACLSQDGHASAHTFKIWLHSKSKFDHSPQVTPASLIRSCHSFRLRRTSSFKLPELYRRFFALHITILLHLPPTQSNRQQTTHGYILVTSSL